MSHEKLTDNEVYTIVIKWILQFAKNDKYINFLKDVLVGIENKKSIEETDQPRYKSIVAGFGNLFPFSIKEYRLMATELLKNNEVIL